MEFDATLYRSLLDSMSDGVYLVDRDGRITYWNRAAEALTGFSADIVMGSRCSQGILNHMDTKGNVLCKVGCPLRRTMDDGETHESEIFLRHRDGHRVPVLVRASPVRNGDGEIVGAVETFQDNSKKDEALRRVRDLEVMAFLDGLTGVGNRRYAEFALSARLREMDRYDWPFGLLFIDLDEFKQVNDRHGHDAGDKVLKQVAKTLEGSLRSFDFAGRWGGEEFVAVVTNVDEARLLRAAERFRSLVEDSFLTTENGKVRVTVSIGATLAEPDDTLESLVGRADKLMYQSKTGGRNRVTVG